MASAICFKCGSEKPGVLLACYKCSIAPKSNSEHAVSLALSDQISSSAQLAEYSRELRSGLKLSVPRDALLHALEALKDPQLRATLGFQSAATSNSNTHSPPPPLPPPPPPIFEADTQCSAPDLGSGESESRHASTVLHQSPFSLLGVSIRDNRRKIVELAEEKSFEADYEACQKARSDLTNPRTRLSAEIAWLPGVSPRRASQLVDALLHNRIAIRAETGLPTLAQLNLLAALFESVDFIDESVDLSELIREFADLADELAPDQVFRDINEDRSVAGFPAISSLNLIESELADRKRYYLRSIKFVLNSLPPNVLVQTMTRVVQAATLAGETHASELIDVNRPGFRGGCLV